MSKMCHACGSEGTTMDEAHVCQNCSSYFCGECDKVEKVSTLNIEMESSSMDLSPCSTPYGTPLFSRASSFSSFASCLSSLGDSPMDIDFEEREEVVELLDTGQPHPNILFSDQFMEQENGASVEETCFQLGHAIVVEDGVHFPVSAEENISSNQLRLDTHKDNTEENIEVSNNMLDIDASCQPHPDFPSSNRFTEKVNGGSVEDKPSHAIVVEDGISIPVSGGEIIPLNQPLLDHEDGTKENNLVSNNILDTDSPVKSGADLENGSGYLYPPVLSSFEKDPLIWIPPQPANMEDEMDNIANNDDDSDNGSARWGQSSFSTSFNEERSNENREEQLRKAMSEVMNGQFKVLVSRFLAAEGFSLSDGETGKSWLDIVASLSWDAALLVKPDASVGNEMDPGLYVKVKCIASGFRQQCEVIKGFVFKKNAGLKQMRTNIKHPRLLLLRGVLGHSSAGLSSMNSMKQENEQLEKSINEVIETCHPDVILVEKTVTRDVHQYLLKQGVTVVSDINIRRLERIARCTGFPITLLQDVVTKHNLAHCESLHFEKIVEEHDIIGEDGRRSSKTFLFLEGFPKPLGCTILLKGATTEELKKVKHVLHFTVFAAYHLILETSFFADQRVFLTDKNATRKENCLKVSPQQFVSSGAAPYSKIPFSDGSTKSSTLTHDLNIPNSDEQYANGESLRSYLPAEEYVSLHGHDSAIKSVVNDIGYTDIDGKAIQSVSSVPFQSRKLVSESFTDFVGDKLSPHDAESTSCNYFDGAGDQSTIFPVTSKEVIMHRKEGAGKNGQEILDGGMPTEIGTTLDPQIILISMSSQHIMKQSVCEKSHLSRITYYGYFDVSLGRYLQDTLLSKKHSCLSCGEPPEAHMYSYTHHNGTLTVLVKSLPLESTLSGGGQGKIWMWTRCLRCKGEPTQRVVISSSARNLSFGKFLELSFSSHSAAKKLSKCGHLLHRDCLRFFGLGSKVAMFRYSSVEIYSACKPPLALEFHNPNRQEWLGVEVKNVLDKGKLLLCEVENIMQDLKSRYSSQVSEKSANSVYQEVLSEVIEMFKQEKTEFEASLKAFDHNLKPQTSVHEILGLNWLYQQLLLGFYVWDRRLHHLLQFKQTKGSFPFDGAVHKSIPKNGLQILENSKKTAVHFDASSSKKLEMESEEVIRNSSNNFHNFPSGEISEMGQLLEKSMIEEHESPYDQDLDARASLPFPGGVGGHVSDQMQVDTSIQIVKEASLGTTTGLQFKGDEKPALARDGETYPVAMSNEHLHMFPNLKIFGCADTERWIWNSFSHLQMDYMKELQGGSLEKFHLINKYTPSYLSLAQLKQQMDLVHFTVGPGGNILSVYEEEISSIIAYVLAISEERGINSEITFEKEELEARRKLDKLTEKSSKLTYDNSVLSSVLSSTESLEKLPNHSSSHAASLSSEESTSGFYDSFLSALKDLHPEICLNSGKVALKSKYTVVCLYAKQFYDLRKMCCPSELAYISSISRCKKWNAQGGKSKAFFAKSMDDRFIIKQIKKTEFDSFLKLGLEYFKHFRVSVDQRNPTCLAKILGIYQVREIKNGKEIRTNLMVMENLLFGHNISRRYDLKGALFSRYVPDSNSPEKVFLDQNFIEDMRAMPIYIGVKAKNVMERAIWNDTSFLYRMNVMDYSLFVGVDKQRKELVFGIIDYLRQYTWDKQLESWVKTSLVVPKNLSPTVISPKEYKMRFRAFMAQYFPSVPDDWSSEPLLFCDYGGST